MQARVPTERAFGTSVGTACLALGALLAWRGSSAFAVSVAALGALLVVLGRLAPFVLRMPNRYWWRLAQVLGWINARVLLTVFYAAVITPAGVIMRLVGHNPLQPPQPQTSWRPYSSRRRDPKHYERMF
jgi:hypothetical protein